MPRKVRQESGTGICHVMMRGINHQNKFEDEEDCWQFIATLDRMPQTCPCSICGILIVNSTK